MTWQLANAKVWDGSQWVAAVGGGGEWNGVFKFLSSTVTLTGSATPHVKGAWFEIVASTSDLVDFMNLVITTNQSGVDTATLLDIGIGAAGSEVAICENIAVGGQNGYNIPLVVQVPSGSRLAARIQSVVVSKSATLSVVAYAGPNPAGTSTSATVLGSSTTTSTGTQLSGSNNVWVQIAASTSVAYQALAPVISITSNTVPANLTSAYTMGIGAAGSEVSKMSLVGTRDAQERIFSPNVAIPFFKDTVSAGSRLAVTMNTNASSVCDACIIATEVIGV